MACRFCYSFTSLINKSIYDGNVLKFLEIVPSISILSDVSAPKGICNFCYTKAKICIDFVSKILEAQKLFIENGNINNQTDEFNNRIIQNFQQANEIVIKKVSSFTSEDDSVDCLEEFLDPDMDESTNGDEIFDEDEEPEDYIPNHKPKQKHQKQMATKIMFTCSNCKSTFANIDLLSAHMISRICFNDIIQCEECSETFGTKNQLYHHKQKHKLKEINETSICDICSEEFKSRYALDVHIESNHRRIVRQGCIFRCYSCHDTFESYLDLFEHVQQHKKEKNENPRLCEICAKVCTNLKTYLKHKSTHNPRKFPYVCKTCSKSFTAFFKLTQHMHIHTGIKGFKCDLCGVPYAKRDSLRLHMIKLHINKMASK
ncbi:CLUMA_CG005108, isoform A [Clunio marinus]|uniref:CLUMA_CG005108, isoform A n=1 Tax=Clunio marinus TaxID=568069 RepID=A0A1J1HVP5_9DIPT|nr:CLUMA_CG005108, isoform A [Clunio marinus]